MYVLRRFLEKVIPVKPKFVGLDSRLRGNDDGIFFPGKHVKPLETKLFEPAQEGIVEMAISPQQPGRVRVLGVSWAARPYIQADQPALTVGTSVKVVGRRGNTLLVRPIVPIEDALFPAVKGEAEGEEK